MERKFNFERKVATPIANPEPIMTANGPIFHIQNANIHLTSTERAVIKLTCVVSPKTYETPVSMLNCVQNHHAIIFEEHSTYVVPDTHFHEIKKKLVVIAEVHDKAYIIKTAHIARNGSGVEGHAKSATATITKTNNQNQYEIKFN